MDDFCEEWVNHLDREDRTLLGIFLYAQMKTLLAKGETETAELAGIMTGRSDKSIRDWKLKCVDGGGVMPDFKQGHYQRTGVLWNNEYLNKKAS